MKKQSETSGKEGSQMEQIHARYNRIFALGVFAIAFVVFIMTVVSYSRASGIAVNISLPDTQWVFLIPQVTRFL